MPSCKPLFSPTARGSKRDECVHCTSGRRVRFPKAQERRTVSGAAQSLHGSAEFDQLLAAEFCKLDPAFPATFTFSVIAEFPLAAIGVAVSLQVTN